MQPSSMRTRQQHQAQASAAGSATHSDSPASHQRGSGRPPCADSGQDSDSSHESTPLRSRPSAFFFTFSSPRTKTVLIFGVLATLAALSLLSEVARHTLSDVRSRFEARWRDAGQPSQVNPPVFAWASPDWAEQHARLVRALEPGDYQGLHNVSRLRLGRDDSTTADPQLAYHLVITSCYRPHWGRYLATTLLHVWLQEAGPTTLTIMWCQPYNASVPMASLFFNQRYSSNIRLLHVPSESLSGVVVHPVSTYFWALMVPDYLERPDLPLVVMEDDAVLVPHFSDKMRSALSWVQRMADKGSAHIMLNLYKPQGPISNASQMLDPAVYNSKSRKAFLRPYNADGDDAPPSNSSPLDPTAHTLWWRPLRRPPHGSLVRGSRAWAYGVQGQFFSPALHPLVARHFWEVQTGRYRVEGYQDMILHQFMFERRGTGLRELWGVRPSMMQHTGAASGVFGGVSMRFHMAPEYPFHVQVPTFDEAMAW